MKSLVMTLIIFAAICLLLSFGILDILMSSNFLYLSLSILAIVIICAITFIGVPQIRITNNLCPHVHKREHRQKLKKRLSAVQRK